MLGCWVVWVLVAVLFVVVFIVADALWVAYCVVSG